jgi:hypothetical protein
VDYCAKCRESRRRTQGFARETRAQEHWATQANVAIMPEMEGEFLDKKTTAAFFYRHPMPAM